MEGKKYVLQHDIYEKNEICYIVLYYNILFVYDDSDGCFIEKTGNYYWG